MKYVARSFAMAALAALLLPASAPAQAQDLAPLNDRVQRLERSVNDLKAHVLGGRPMPAGTQTPAPSAAAGGDSASLKVQALEEEVRSLTNRIEEIDFTVRRLNDRMDKLVADIDFRLTSIERNMAAGGPQPAAGATPGEDSDGANSSMGGAQGPRNLGTVSPEAVERIPRPEAGAESGAAETAAVAKPPAGTAAAAGTPREEYEAAFGLLRSKRFGEAEDAFTAFLQRHPDDELAGNAQYWLGETYYVQQDYEQAASAFLEGYKKYRGSSKAPDNLLKLGMTLTKLNQNKDACAVFDELGDRYPDAPRTITRRAEIERKKAGC